LLSIEAQERLSELEAELHFQFRRDAKNVIRIGGVLFHVRALIRQDLKARGLPANQRNEGFKAWCAEQGLNRQSVYRYLAVYECFRESRLETREDIPATVLFMLAQPSTPAHVRKTFVAKWERGEAVTVDEVRRAIALAKGGKKPRMTPIEFVGKLGEALDWWQKEQIRLEENAALTDGDIYPERKAEYAKKLTYARGRIDGLTFTRTLLACVQRGENPVIFAGDFPNEFSIELGEVAAKWGQFDEFAIEIEEVKSC
jgi:hypothetical protein